MAQQIKKENREKIQKKKKKYLVQQSDKFQNIIQNVGSFAFHMSDVIGQGTYGKVYKAFKQKDKQKTKVYACKVIKKEKLDNLQMYNKQYAKQLNQRLKRQGQFQLSLKECPYIARMYQTYENQKAYYYIMEYCQTDLAKILKKQRVFTTQRALKYFSQILKGVKFIYQKNAFHRDLKPQNLLIKDDTIKISDFGFVKIFTQIDKQCKSGRNKFRTQSKVGTFRYMSPDILKLLLCQQQQTQNSVGSNYLPQKSDVWSLGIILYKMLYGKQPYDGKDENQMIKKINQNKLQFPETIQTKPYQISQSKVPKQLIKLMKKMIQKDPSKRIKFLTLYEQIHTFIEVKEEMQKKSSIEPENQQNKSEQRNKKQKLLNIYQKMIKMIHFDCVNYATIRQIGIDQYVQYSYKLMTLIHQKRSAFLLLDQNKSQVSQKIKSEITVYQNTFYSEIKMKSHLNNDDKLKDLLMKVYQCLASYQDYDQLIRQVQLFLLILLLLLSLQNRVVQEEYLFQFVNKSQAFKQKTVINFKQDAMNKMKQYLHEIAKKKQSKSKSQSKQQNNQKVKQNDQKKQKKDRESQSRAKARDKVKQKVEMEINKIQGQQCQSNEILTSKKQQNLQNDKIKEKKSKSKRIRQSSRKKQ